MKLSIIIPAYNVEKYIVKCLESVLLCRSNDYEVIVVNDGSTDNTADLVKAQCDGRLRLITQQNRGVSAARNAGLLYATGDYVWYVDADDYVCNDAVEQILDRLIDIDILAINARRIVERDKLNNNDVYDYTYIRGGNIGGIEFLDNVLQYDPKFDWFVWAFVFSRRLLNESKLLFREGYKFEDIDFIYKIILHAKMIAVLNKSIYMYHVGRIGSITTTISVNKEADLLFISAENIRIVSEMNVYEPLKMKLMNNFSYNYYNVLLDYCLCNEKKEVFELLKQYRSMVNYTKIGKMRLVALTTRLFGIKAGAWLVYLNSLRRGNSR